MAQYVIKNIKNSGPLPVLIFFGLVGYIGARLFFLLSDGKRKNSFSSTFVAPSGGSALGPAEKERDLVSPPADIIDEASFESFPASDPPAW